MNPNLVKPNKKVSFQRRFSIYVGATSVGRAMEERTLTFTGKVVGLHRCCAQFVVVLLDKESRKKAFDEANYPYTCLVVNVDDLQVRE